MRALVQDRYGSADVLRLRDVKWPRPADDQVLVRVHAAGVDPGVWHLMTGLPYPVRLASGLRRPRHRVPGMDLAGVVEAVGPRVTRLALGDEVYGTGTGSFAEYALAPAHKLARKPAGLGFAEAAAVPVSAQTALTAVRDVARVRPGQRVLVIGAAGGVGHFAVQLAVAAGAHVTGVCGPTKTDLVRSLGAAEVVDHNREEITDRGLRYDVVVDTAGNRPLTRLRRALTPTGTLVLVGGESVGGRLFRGFDRQLRALLLSPLVRQRLVPLVAKESTDNLDALTALIDSGQLRPVVDRTWPLTETPEAIRHLAGGHARGKNVVLP
ncbi:NAD(P)-dependent alcohol dehydrogenase [Micromonospora coxensis]|uniref:NAD(P)-dependent alcohol dehydrogenase n=1 Tax=Micromonospora coxensis TaxID=356852 RepID=UPI0034166521